MCDIHYYVLFLLAGEAYQAGEGRHLGDDSEAPGELAAPAGCNVCSYRPRRAEQVPGRVQRVCWRGWPLPWT